MVPFYYRRYVAFYAAFTNRYVVFTGVGYAAAIMAFWLDVYYIVVLAWALYYIVQAMAITVPWGTCDNWWNTKYCRSEYSNVTLWKTDLNCTYTLNSSTAMIIEIAGGKHCQDVNMSVPFIDSKKFIGPVKEFWE